MLISFSQVQFFFKHIIILNFDFKIRFNFGNNKKGIIIYYSVLLKFLIKDIFIKIINSFINLLSKCKLFYFLFYFSKCFMNKNV